MAATRVALSAFLVACAHDASTVVEIPPAPLPEPSVTVQVALPQAAPRAAGACEAPADLAGCTEMARLRVGRVELSSPTCFVDAKVHEGDRGRLVKCASGAVAVFSRVSFAGAWNESGIDTCLRTQFPFEDGCTWQTMQRVRGGPSVLEFTYAEHPVSGVRCLPSTCTARADIEVEEP